MNNTFLTQDLRTRLSAQIDEICRRVGSENKLHNTDINNILEDIFKEALNLGLGLTLDNLNDGTKQEAGIDLGDEKAKICYQITAESTSSKIHDCLDQYEDKKWYEKYDHMYILFANDYKTTFDSLKKKLKEKTYSFDYNECVSIINKNDLKTLLFKGGLENIEKVVAYLDRELKSSVDNPTKSVGIINDIISHCVSSMKGAAIETKTNQDLSIFTKEKIRLNFTDSDEAEYVARYILESVLASTDLNDAINYFPGLDSSDLEGYMSHTYLRFSQNSKSPLETLLKMFDFFTPDNKIDDYAYLAWVRRFVGKFFENCTIFKKTKNEMVQVSLL